MKFLLYTKQSILGTYTGLTVTAGTCRRQQKTVGTDTRLQDVCKLLFII